MILDIPSSDLPHEPSQLKKTMGRKHIHLKPTILLDSSKLGISEKQPSKLREFLVFQILPSLVYSSLG